MHFKDRQGAGSHAVLQIAKLLVIPFVCMVERFFFGKYFSRQVLGTIVMVALGVAVV